MERDYVSLVVTDTLGDLIMDQLALISGPALGDAIRDARQVVQALADWAESQGAGEVRAALDQLASRIGGDPLAEDWAGQRPPIH